MNEYATAEDIPFTTADVFLPEMLHDALHAEDVGCTYGLDVRVLPIEDWVSVPFVVWHGFSSRRFAFPRGDVRPAIERAGAWLRAAHAPAVEAP